MVARKQGSVFQSFIASAFQHRSTGLTRKLLEQGSSLDGTWRNSTAPVCSLTVRKECVLCCHGASSPRHMWSSVGIERQEVNTLSARLCRWGGSVNADARRSRTAARNRTQPPRVATETYFTDVGNSNHLKPFSASSIHTAGGTTLVMGVCRSGTCAKAAMTDDTPHHRPRSLFGPSNIHHSMFGGTGPASAVGR